MTDDGPPDVYLYPPIGDLYTPAPTPPPELSVPVEVFPPALPLDVLAATGVHEVVYLLLAVAALAVMFGCLAVLSYRIHPRYKRQGNR